MEPLKMKYGIHNKFEIEVVDAKTGKVKQKAIAYNTICASFWNHGCMNKNVRIQYGSGSGTPSVSDTGMFNYVGSITTSVYDQRCDLENGIYSVTRKGTLQTSESVGVTITEVGNECSYTEYSTWWELHTHAMLKDQNGNPISILKTNLDVINFYSTVYVHYTVKPDGLYNYGSRYTIPMQLTGMFNNLMYPDGGWRIILYNSQRIGASRQGQYYSYDLNDEPAEDFSIIGISSSYNSSTKKWTWSTRAEAGAGNLNYGARNIMWGPCVAYIYGNCTRSYLIGRAGDGEDWFDYSQINNEAVGTGDGTTSDFKLDFMYPKDVVVKVDGVVESNVTVDYAPPTTDFSYYIDMLRPESTPTNLIPRRLESEHQIIMRNPAHVVGIDSFTAETGDVEASNNMINWTNIGTMSSNGTFTVPSGYKNHKYFRYNLAPRSTITVTAASSYTGYNLHFATPPAANSIITASYKADCIAKDSDKVFDFKMEIELTEFTQ